jgi:hypothetical protein
VTLPLPGRVSDPATQRALDEIAQQFPIAGGNLALPAWGPYFAHPNVGGASIAITFANNLAYAQVQVLNPSTLTGIGYWVGGTSAGNVRCALYDSAGNRVANRTSNLAQAAINTFQKVAFDSTYVAAPGIYFAAVIFNTATATLVAGKGLSPAGGAIQGGFTTPSTITVPTAPGATDILCTTY